ncbi:MAG: oligosaccharide flippase family protein [Chloroflexota bacterium]
MKKPFLEKGLIKLSQKGGVAILDQGLYSLINFIANIILARSLIQEEYGAFAIVFAIYALCYHPYSALILEPMSVLLQSRHTDEFRKHIQEHLLLHFVLTAPFGLLIIVCGLVLWKIGQIRVLYQSFFIMGAIIPIILLYWLFRQIFYILEKPSISLSGSLIYSIGMATSLGFLSYTHRLTTNSVLISMGINNLLVCVFFVLLLRIGKSVINQLNFRQRVINNWKYGKWMVLSAVFISIATEGPILILSGISGVGAAGIIRAAKNIIRPIQISIISISSYALPVLSREIGENREPQFRNKNRFFQIMLVSLAIAYELVIIVFRHPIERFLYDGNYSEYVNLFPLWGLVAIAMSLLYGYSLRVKARQQPQIYSYASMAFGAISMLLGGIVLIPLWNVWGVPITVLAGYIGAIFFLLLFSKIDLK